MKENYKTYRVNLRYDTDQRIIDYIEQNKDTTGVTPIIREALENLIKWRSLMAVLKMQHTSLYTQKNNFKRGLDNELNSWYILIKQGARRSATPPERGWANATDDNVSCIYIHDNDNR